jgi:hypothetical protein
VIFEKNSKPDRQLMLLGKMAEITTTLINIHIKAYRNRTADETYWMINPAELIRLPNK